MEEEMRKVADNALIIEKLERLEKGVETIYRLLVDKQKVLAQPVEATDAYCNEHGEPMEKGISKTKFNKDGSPKAYLFHKVDGKMCFGKGVVT